MYYFLYGFIYIISLLPLRVLFILSDFFTWLVYSVIGYRKEVVMKNLDIAFPEKSLEEKKRIAKRFYRNLIDTFIETIKLLSASEKFMCRHMTGNVPVLNELFDEGRKCQVHLGHNFNWEMANSSIPLMISYQMLTVYMPINNKVIDRLFLKIRTRTGAVLLPATTMSRAMIPWRNTQYLMALVADQNPGVPAKAFWTEFFGRPTPFVTGPEKNAIANNAAVVFAHFTKPKRGYYIVHFSLATKEPGKLREGELTLTYKRYLEQTIRENPDMWLWSHRRWKHEYKPEYGPLIEERLV